MLAELDVLLAAVFCGAGDLLSGRGALGEG
jgi:hypothetical protein